MLGDEVFFLFFDPMLLQEIFQTPFSNNNDFKKYIKKYIKKKLPARGTPETHMSRKQVVAKYLNVWSGRLLLSIKKEVSESFSFSGRSTFCSFAVLHGQKLKRNLPLQIFNNRKRGWGG